MGRRSARYCRTWIINMFWIHRFSTMSLNATSRWTVIGTSRYMWKQNGTVFTLMLLESASWPDCYIVVQDFSGRSCTWRLWNELKFNSIRLVFWLGYRGCFYFFLYGGNHFIKCPFKADEQHTPDSNREFIISRFEFKYCHFL